MCGIVGYLDKREQADFPLGRTLLGMLQALACRGPDSAGVALFGGRGEMRLRLSVPTDTDRDALSDALQDDGLTILRSYGTGIVDARIAADVDLAKLEERIRRRLPGSEILCLGEHMTLFKQVGSPDELEASYLISALRGTHGIGHTRMSTESRVDLSHSQPFWTHGVADLATVHNGHITNYHKLRRRYEQEGYRFYTDNDSEIIGIYLRDRMAAGRSLEGAMRSSLEDFDGSFCYLVATKDQFGFVKDRYGFKPLMLAETEDFVAVATEEIALRRALGRDFPAHEPAPGTLRLWSINPELAPVSPN
ncbi:MAG: glutamine phosphoribosylpyrophosphate amidotransferase [Gemmataceae bacterium]